MVIKHLSAIIRKEFLSILKDPKSRIIIVVPPLIQFLIFANALTMETRNVNMMVLDNSNTLESREFISNINSNKWFKNVKMVSSPQQIEIAVREQRANAGLIIDSDFATNLKRGKSPSVMLILDGRTTNTASAINGYMTQIANTYSQKIARKNVSEPTATITINTRTWFNPNADYQWYFVIGLIVMLSLVITLILTALSVARERELGTFEQLIVSPYTATEILIGKTVPPLVISMFMVAVMTLCAVLFFGIPFNGAFGLLLLSCFIALLSLVGVGLYISSISKNQQQAILGAFAFLMPAILLAGFISPIDDMPRLLQLITWANPLRFFMNIARGLFLKAMPVTDVLYNLIPLIIIAGITLTLAARTFKRNLE